MDEQNFDLRGILGLLRRHIGLIFMTLVLVVGVASVVLFALKPVYTASALVLVDPSRKDLLDPTQQVTNSQADSARVDSEVELVRAPTTLLRAIKALNLVDDAEYGVKLSFRQLVMAFFKLESAALPTGDAALQDVISNLRDAVTVQRRGLTYLIAISARSVDPAKSAVLANAIADAYIREQLDSKIASTLASRDIVEGRIQDTGTAVVASEEAFDTFISDNIDTIATKTGRTDIADMRAQLDELNSQRSRQSAIAELADRSLVRKDWSSLAQTLQSDEITQLQASREAIEKNLAGADVNAALDLRAELDKIDTELSTTARAELTTMRLQISSAQARASDLRGQLRTSVLDSDLPPEILTSIYQLQQSAEIARTQYQTLLARQKELEGQAFLQQADSRVVSQALAPASPSFPNPPLILVLSAVAGLALGIGLSFFVEYFVGGFTSEGQLQAVLRTPVTATVPRQKALKKNAGGRGMSLAEYVTRLPLSIFAESVRRLRAGIDLAFRRSHGPSDSTSAGMIVMITSAAPNEGKSTLSLSVARAYAAAGRKTLLIDCDLRKPSLHRHVGLETERSVIDYLTQRDNRPPLESILKIDPESGAYLALGARRSDTATDHLISGTAFSDLLREAAAEFEVVVLDTPPIGPVVDGLYLAPFADVIAFVVKWATTSQQDVRSALAALNSAKKPKAEILAILNQQDTSRARYRSKYAGYYEEV